MELDKFRDEDNNVIYSPEVFSAMTSYNKEIFKDRPNWRLYQFIDYSLGGVKTQKKVKFIESALRLGNAEVTEYIKIKSKGKYTPEILFAEKASQEKEGIDPKQIDADLYMTSEAISGITSLGVEIINGFSIRVRNVDMGGGRYALNVRNLIHVLERVFKPEALRLYEELTKPHNDSIKLHR